MSIYNFTVKTIDGKEKSLAEYKGKVLLIVNVASQCGFTNQYEGLEALYKKYGSKGLEVLGFPCNQFGNQEPGSETQIKEFCQTKFGIEFPMFAKIEVNGPGTHPLYVYLKEKQKGFLGTEAIKWNFTKFLINRQGEVIKRFAPQSTPESLENDILSLLG